MNTPRPKGITFEIRRDVRKQLERGEHPMFQEQLELTPEQVALMQNSSLWALLCRILEIEEPDQSPYAKLWLRGTLQVIDEQVDVPQLETCDFNGLMFMLGHLKMAEAQSIAQQTERKRADLRAFIAEPFYTISEAVDTGLLAQPFGKRSWTTFEKRHVSRMPAFDAELFPELLELEEEAFKVRQQTEQEVEAYNVLLETEALKITEQNAADYAEAKRQRDEQKQREQEAKERAATEGLYQLAYDPLRFKHHGASEALKSWTLRKAPFDVDTLEQWQVVTLKPEGGELKQVKGDVKQENYDDVVMHPREVTADCLVVLMQWRRGQRTVEHRHAYYVDAALHISSVSQSDEETVYERWKDSGLIKPQTQ